MNRSHFSISNIYRLWVLADNTKHLLSARICCQITQKKKNPTPHSLNGGILKDHLCPTQIA